MEKLIHGVIRFREEVYPRLESHFQDLATRQAPEALFVTCADSRIVPDLLTQTHPGELFICRNAGNIVPPHGEATGGVSATIEYAVAALHVKHIIVCGHSDCGAMKGILHPERLTDMPAVASWLRYGDVARRVVLSGPQREEGPACIEALSRENVRAQLVNLRTHPSVAARMAQGELRIHGWFYHIGSGLIEVYDERSGRFRPLTVADAALAGETKLPEVA